MKHLKLYNEGLENLSKVVFLYDAKARLMTTSHIFNNFTLNKVYDVIISSDRLNFQIMTDTHQYVGLSHVYIDNGMFVEVHKMRDDKLNTILKDETNS